MGETEKCYKFGGFHKVNEASSICGDLNAKLPLPRTIQQNSDLVYVLRSLGLDIRTVLDANDLDRNKFKNKVSRLNFEFDFEISRKE